MGRQKTRPKMAPRRYGWIARAPLAMIEGSRLSRMLAKFTRRDTPPPRLSEHGEIELWQVMHKAQDLLVRGRAQEAHSVIENGMVRLGELTQLCFHAANAVAERGDLASLPEIDRLRLQLLNKPFLREGLAPLQLKDPAERLTLDNLTAIPSEMPDPRSDEAKISVLMPAYNTESLIGMAIESILNQTWANLELIVVDDGSSDDTWSVIESFAARDPRVVALRHEANRGAYSARNTALRRATGDFVTVNDSDDWSHPQRLALQMIDLLDNRHVVNTTSLVRVDTNLRASTKKGGVIVIESFCSMMSRRETLKALGGWDEVRMGADNELYHRFLLKHGVKKRILHETVPLTLSATRSDSLTAHPDIGMDSFKYGARRQYREAFHYWHRLEMAKPQPDLVIRPGERRFPIPHICKVGPRRRLDYDVLFVSDFALPGGTTSSNVGMLYAIKALGLRSACFHWPRLNSVGRDINLKIRKLLHEEIADNVVTREAVTCKLVIVNHPPLLNHELTTRPEVQTDSCIVVVNQAPMTRYVGGLAAYDVADIIEKAQSAFGPMPLLAPVSPLIRRLLKAEIDGLGMTALDWTPLIDVAKSRRAASSWDGSRPPIVGRLARDAREKWPSEADVLRQAYCAEAPVEMRILGGAKKAEEIMGIIPSNWCVMPFDSVDVPRFLNGLDFLVHYPHEHCIDACARAPLEAMATGIPTILPPSYRETHGDGAIYVDPAGVLDVIQALWGDRESYEAQVRRGYDFVERTCSCAKFAERVAPYIGAQRERDVV